MWPKEHGAYGQLVFPLVTAFVVGGVTMSAAMTGMAATAGFVAHEPLLVLLGRRGPRAKRDQGPQARRWLVISGMVAGLAGTLALWLAPEGTRWAFAMPLIPTIAVAVALVVGREKDTWGELAVATALSFVAIPVSLSAGASAATAMSVGLAFASLFVSSTLGVRVVILKVRRGGDARAVRITRLFWAMFSTVVLIALGIATKVNALPSTPLVAVIPGLLASGALAARPPAASRLRIVGWTLVSISAVAAVVLMAGLRRA